MSRLMDTTVEWDWVGQVHVVTIKHQIQLDAHVGLPFVVALAVTLVSLTAVLVLEFEQVKLMVMSR